MTMRTLTTFLSGAMLCSTLSAQDVIVRQRNGTSHFYYLPNTGASIQTVINEAANGDTIHLPGVNYALSANLTINKGVVLVGSGIRPDSADAYTAPTRFVSSGGARVYIVSDVGGNPSNLEIHGITFTGYVGIGDGGSHNHSTTVMNGVKFIRCDFHSRMVLGPNANAGVAGWNSAATGTVIRSCIFRDFLRVDKAPNTSVQNSFIKHLYNGGDGTSIVNCVFMDFNQNGSNGNANVIYRSNIFMRATGSNYAISEASTFQNNIFIVQGASVVSWPAAVSATNNQQTTVLANVFVNNLSLSDFSYDRNYHIVPGPYQTMAFDGGEVGVYGTNGQPMKDGLLPFNPHWINLSAQGSTSGGTLQNVNIKGSAQTH